MHNYSITEQCKIVLQRGALIRVVYRLDDNNMEWKLVAHKDLLDKLQLTGYCNVAKEYIDVLNKEAFPIDNVTIDCFYFCELPAGIVSKDFHGDTNITKHFGQDFLFNDDTYLKGILNEINKQTAEFLEYITQQIELLNTFDTEIVKVYFNVRFYPEKCNRSKSEITERIIQNSKQKYFIWLNKDKPIQPILRYLGLDNSCINIRDLEFIENFKLIWFKFIQNRALFTLKDLHTLYAKIENKLKVKEKKMKYNQVISFDKVDLLSENELAELKLQIESYEEMINNIKINILEDCNCVGSIIKTWPSILVQPFFYDDN